MHDMAFRVGNQYKINTRGKVEFNGVQSGVQLKKCSHSLFGLKRHRNCIALYYENIKKLQICFNLTGVQYDIVILELHLLSGGSLTAERSLSAWPAELGVKAREIEAMLPQGAVQGGAAS